MTPSDERIDVVVIDDDEQHLALLDRALRDPLPAGARGAEFTVQCHADPTDALASVPPEGPVVFLCDYSMPGGTGLDWLPDFLRLDRGPVIIMTGHGDEEIAAEAFRRGASDYLVKSHVLENSHLLRRAIGEAWRHHRLEDRNRQLTRQLKLANEVLETKNRKLRTMTETAHRFVDDVAHDLRTPLTVIGEFASIIRDGIDGPVNDQQVEHLQMIRDAAGELSQMVDDFLDSSRLRAGRLRVDRRPHEVSEIFDAVRPMLEVRAASRRMQLTETIDAGLPRVFADQEKVQRILVNLMQNAIKFSQPEREIHLWARAAAYGGVEIGVTDHGAGMCADALRMIFDRFQQVDGADSGSVKGFGLGLAIVKELVGLNLGTVSVTSEPGVGSTFSFTLPPVTRGSIIARVVEITGDRPISALTARLTDDDGDVEAVRDFLASSCYPMDIAVTDHDERGVTLLGVTSEPEQWVARLQAIVNEAPADGWPPEACAFECHVVGRWWSATRDRERLLDALHVDAGTAAAA